MSAISDIEILRELINESCIIPLQDSYKGKKKVILKESSDNIEYTVTIDSIPNKAEVIVFKIDNFQAPQDIFRCSKGECKRADFVIIVNINAKKFIILIEMKAGKAKRKHIIQQLQGAQCVIAYCQKIGQIFWQKLDFLSNDDYQYRFISIKDISITKDIIDDDSPNPTHDSPEKMLKITSPKGLTFKRLL
ncbi:conserved hypothetical protein [Rippkaea orientalis PCC 8801]|uniref:Uncharacterized protein n=1 Tax=Rippkaea orientalis (strain PCC 8801 / RF-1) TaxID=41431 RepID=B7K3K3_RIPO1|nr:hypothetical protein [Rippkaea orientalis]ACK65345.1 conserved hypothetical protein [Rippkaea orientalis PCC 8801]